MQLNLLVKPAAEVNVGGNLVYLYPAGMGDVGGYCGIADGVEPLEKLRMLLPQVASLSVPQSFREQREPLAEELVAAMSSVELEQIAAIYVENPSFDKVRAGNGDVKPVARRANETAAAYLERLMNAEGERQRRIFEKLDTL